MGNAAWPSLGRRVFLVCVSGWGGPRFFQTLSNNICFPNLLSPSKQ